MRFLKPNTSGYMTTERNGSQSRYLTIAHSDALNLGTTAAMPAFSASCHINPQTPTNTWNMLISKATSTYTYSIYWHLTGNEFRVYCIMKNDAGTACYGSWYASDGTQWSENTWIHLVLCWDPAGSSVANSWKCFIDGSKLEDNSGCSGGFGESGIYLDTGSNFTIGGRGDGSSYYPHDFHYKDVSIWNTFLDDDKAKSLQYRNPIKGEQGLVCYWPLSGDFKDRGGVNNYDLTPYYSGYAPTFTANKRIGDRRSFSTSTSSDWTTTASSSGINAARASSADAWDFGSSDWTIEFWFAMCEMDQSTERILSVWKTTTECAFFIDRVIYSSYGIYFKCGYSGNGSSSGYPYKYQYFSSTVSPNTKRVAHCQWTHFAWAFDNSGANPKAQCQFYIDGVLQNNPGNTSYEHPGSGSAVSSIYDADAQLVIGNQDAGNDVASKNFDGRICELRMWDTLRSSGEISDNYQKQISPTTSNLVGYWPGHPNSNGDIEDVTSNSNHLVVDGAGVRFSNTHPFL